MHADKDYKMPVSYACMNNKHWTKMFIGKLTIPSTGGKSNFLSDRLFIISSSKEICLTIFASLWLQFNIIIKKITNAVRKARKLSILLHLSSTEMFHVDMYTGNIDNLLGIIELLTCMQKQAFISMYVFLDEKRSIDNLAKH